ncbi:MAG: hypothetical protein LBS50_01205 [Prevotellaceae bacterium]|nr:hypothetical protein [Prevotellaceae bacterium]
MNPLSSGTIVKWLTNDGIMDKTGNEYFISDPFFKMFSKKLQILKNIFNFAFFN